MLLDVKIMFDKALSAILPEQTKNRAELTEFLLKHERKDLAIKNLCNQIMIAESRVRIKMDRAKLQTLVRTSAQMFAQAAVNVKIQEMMSHAERKRIESDKSKYDEIKSVVKGLEDVDDASATPP